MKRSDALAVKLGCNVEELVAVVGLSRASLFSYRTGKRKISSKAWAKLEEAEREAGIAVRTKSHLLLQDVPVNEQPSDALLFAAHREHEARNPQVKQRALWREIRALLEVRYANDAAQLDREWERIYHLYLEACLEARTGMAGVIEHALVGLLPSLRDESDMDEPTKEVTEPKGKATDEN